MENTNKKNVWLDCDPGVDDIFAIYMSVYHPRINLLGISVVHGNTSVENCLQNAKRALLFVGKTDIPLLKGSHQPMDPWRKATSAQSIHGGVHKEFIDESVPLENYQGFTNSNDQKDHYVDIMFETIKKNSPVSLVVTGTATNIAQMMYKYPEVEKHIELVSFMGGVLGLGNVTPSAEFNVYCDPESYRYLLNSQLGENKKLAFIPLDVTHTCLADDSVNGRIQELGTKFSQVCLGLINQFTNAYQSIYGLNFPPLHDPIAMFYAINSQAFEKRFVNVYVDTDSKVNDGRTVVDYHKKTIRVENAYWTTAVQTGLFWDEMIFCLNEANKDFNNRVNLLKK